MIIVISCSNSKNGEILRHDGQDIAFCAHPDKAPEDGKRYVHPDELMNGKTWREWVTNHQVGHNLIEAYQLYKRDLYRELQQKYKNKLFIFSAGWGIICASFKLPVYDITFSSLKPEERFKHRQINDTSFRDYNHLEHISSDEDILFIAGGAYMLSFCHLTAMLNNKKRIIYKSKLGKDIQEYVDRPDYSFEEYTEINNPFTNWHYVYVNNVLLNK